MCKTKIFFIFSNFDPRNPYLQYYMHYDQYRVNTAVPQTNYGKRIQIGTPKTAKDACPFAGFLYIKEVFTSPASTKGGSKAAAKFINPAGGLRIFSNGEVRLYKAITNPQDVKPWIGSVKKIQKPLLFGTNQEGAQGSFSDAEKVAWCVDPYKNFCAKVFELYRERDGTGTLSTDGSLSRIPFEVIEIFTVGRLVTIRSFNPGDDVENCPLPAGNTRTDCKASSDSAGLELDFLPVQCPTPRDFSDDQQNAWNEITHKNAPEKYRRPPAPATEDAVGDRPPRRDCEGDWGEPSPCLRPINKHQMCSSPDFM